MFYFPSIQMFLDWYKRLTQVRPEDSGGSSRSGGSKLGQPLEKIRKQKPYHHYISYYLL